MRIKIYSLLLKLDSAVLVSDYPVAKLIKRKLLKPVGFYFRRKHYQIKYKKQTW